MRVPSFRASRVLVAAATAGLIGLAAAGCSGGTASSAPQANQPAANPATAAALPHAGQATSPSTKDSAPVKASTVQALKFPNTSATVMFTGYDSKNNMPEFQKVVQNPKSPYADLIPDPKDPAVHELALAPGTDVTSIDPNGFPFETCPPVNCTADDVIQSVISHTTLWAHIHVNGADQIDVVNQIAY